MSGARGPWRLGLLGHPVSHSLSPRLHAAALESTGLAGSYEAIDCPDVVALEARIDELRAGRWSGFNVTLPYKREAALRCDVLEGEARVLGVANTLLVRDGQLIGHNTDVAGLVHAIGYRWPLLPINGPAAVLGAGGAARAAVLTAWRLGSPMVRLWNRTRAHAEELVQALAGAEKRTPIVLCSSPEEACEGAALVIQAGSGQMGIAVGSPAWHEAVEQARRAIEGTALDSVVVDLVYTPRQTPWVEAAELAERDGDHGLSMLIEQARWAFYLWTGIVPKYSPLREAVEPFISPE